MTKNRAAHTRGMVMSGGSGEGLCFYSSTSPRPGRRFPVYNVAGRVVGRVDGDTFLKRVSGSRHMLRRPRGWAIDADTLADLLTWGIKDVRVTDTDTGTTYVARLDEFTRHGVPFDRGYGPQVVLPLGYWTINGKPAVLAKRQPGPDAPRQLSLWGNP